MYIHVQLRTIVMYNVILCNGTILHEPGAVYICTCSEASSKSVVDGSGCVDEEQYVFLKRMCQVLVHLGTSQLAKLWVLPIVRLW